MSNIRKLLFPFSVIYDGVTRTKNFLYDNSFLKSISFDIPIIVIGNISVGGTGKTPHTEYLANLFKTKLRTAVLSRGYGRKTTGYILADKSSTAKTIGDEPLQIAQNILGINVAVCEDRATGISKLIKNENAELIILDDAFQHRKVKGSLNILINSYENPFYNDLVLPAGNLRETSANKSRADIIIVSKCPTHLDANEKKSIEKRINPESHQSLFFSHIKYGSPNSFFGSDTWGKNIEVLLVTGIVNPHPLKKHIEGMGKKVTLKEFKDHHDYSIDDIKSLHQNNKKQSNNFVIATTSKDRVKIQSVLDNIDSPLTFFEIPITIGFLFEEEKRFNEIVEEHVSTF